MKGLTMVAATGPASLCTTAHRTHRLLTENALRERLPPEVVDYLLAVRGELVDRFGDVDTYQRYAAELVRCAPHHRHRKPRAIARRLSEHFNCPTGPPWPTVDDVLDYVVPDDRRDECRRRFSDLYTKARNQTPTDAPERVRATPSATDFDLLILENTHLRAELAIRTQLLAECRVEVARVQRCNTTLLLSEENMRLQMVTQSHELEILRKGQNRDYVVGYPSSLYLSTPPKPPRPPQPPGFGPYTAFGPPPSPFDPWFDPPKVDFIDPDAAKRGEPDLPSIPTWAVNAYISKSDNQDDNEGHRPPGYAGHHRRPE